MRRLWRHVLAFFRVSPSAVCEMSSDRWEYHDYQDSTTPVPMHFYKHTCRRCGRRFTI